MKCYRLGIISIVFLLLTSWVLLSIIFESKLYFHHDILLSFEAGNSACESQSHIKTGTFFNLLTKLNVYYTSDQWFHMTENYLVHLHALQRNLALKTNQTAFYNFDKADFVNDLSPFTRFIVYISTKRAYSTAELLVFMNEEHMTSTRVSQNAIFVNEMLFERAYQIVNISNGVPTPQRFVLHDSIHYSDYQYNDHLGKRCVHNGGTIGGKRVKRGEWLPEQEDIRALRQNIRDACPRNQTLVKQFEKKKTYKLLIYQRDKTRRFVSIQKSIELLESLFSSLEWEIQIISHRDDISPCYLSHLLYNVDILVTPHGFQSTLLLFLPIPALLFEVFPFGYHKIVYHTFANELGIRYGHYQSDITFTKPWDTIGKAVYSAISQQQCTKLYLCRALFRNQDVIFDPKGVQILWKLSQFYRPLFQSHPNYAKLDFYNLSTHSIPEKIRYFPVERDSLY